MKTSISIIEKGTDKMPFVLRGDYEESIKEAAKLGFDAVEMHIRDPKEVDIEKIIDSCYKNNINVSSVGTGLGYGLDGLSLSSKDEDNRLLAIQRIKDHIALAKELGAIIIIGLMKGLVDYSEGASKCLDRLEESMKECVKAAEDAGVLLVFETINRYESNLFVTIDETLDFVKKFNSAYLKVHIDTYHMNIEESNFISSVLKCKGWLGHVHIADSDRMYPGHAHIPFDKVFESLNNIGYEGYLAVECLALPDPHTCAQRTIEFFKTHNH